MIISLSEVKTYFGQHHPVACPTETVYGLCAPLGDPLAIDKIFEIKKRPSDNPLIIHVSGKQVLEDYVFNISSTAELLMERFWPGPLTLVLPIKERTIPWGVRAGLATAAFRCPSHPAMQALILAYGPLVAPSCNLSGRPSSTRPEHVEEDFSSSFPIFQGGICSGGIESTILIEEQGRFYLGRRGGISVEKLEEHLNYRLEKKEGPKALCPGQKYRHYSPSCHLNLSSGPYSQQEEVVMGCSRRTYPGAKRVMRWGYYKQAYELTHQLYHSLRELDQQNIKRVWVDTNFPDSGEYIVLKERLSKAASKKKEVKN